MSKIIESNDKCDYCIHQDDGDCPGEWDCPDAYEFKGKKCSVEVEADGD